MPLWPALYFVATETFGLLMGPYSQRNFLLVEAPRGLLLATGWAAFMTIFAHPQRGFMLAPQGLRENTLAILFGGAWGLSIAGAMLFVGQMGGMSSPYSMALLCAAPFAILASLGVMLRLHGRPRGRHATSPRRRVQERTAPPVKKMLFPGHLRLIFDEIATTGLCTLLAAAMIPLASLWWPRGAGEMLDRVPDLRFMLFLIPLLLMMKWLPATAALRMLPIQRRYLTLGITLWPPLLTMGALAGTLVLMWVPPFTFDPGYLVPTLMLAWGINVAVIAITLRFGGWTLYAAIGIGFVSPTLSRDVPTLGLGSIAFGAALVLAGTWGIHQLLGHYPALYRRRYDFGWAKGGGAR